MATPELRLLYYKRLFPTDSVFDWLTAGHPCSQREFSFVLEDDVFRRWCSFSDSKAYHSFLLKNNPLKMDAGAIYSDELRQKETNPKFKGISREFVLDLDLSDYDGIRTCCKEAQMCGDCWLFVQAAVKVLDVALEEDFGFEKRLWVFSGRRGIHCWVFDDRARLLDDGARKAITSFLTLDLERDLDPQEPILHPSLQRAYQLLFPIFEQKILQKHPGVLARERIQDWIPIKYQKLVFQKNLTTEQEQWQQMKKAVQKIQTTAELKTVNDRKDYGKICILLQKIVLSALHPRLDVEVSAHMGHLLKIPFSLHPVTGKICIVIDPKTIDTLDPAHVPTLIQLENDLNQKTGEPQDYLSRFSMSVQLFQQQCVKQPQKKKKKKRHRIEEDLL